MQNYCRYSESAVAFTLCCRSCASCASALMFYTTEHAHQLKVFLLWQAQNYANGKVLVLTTGAVIGCLLCKSRHHMGSNQ